MTSTELTITGDQTRFNEKQLAALAQMGMQNASPAEFFVFFHQCKRTGLDPFARQIYLVPRWSRQAGGYVSTIQTGIDGYRVIADRAPGKRGMPYIAWCDTDGVWVEAWLKPSPPAACKVIVTRDGEPFPSVATYAEYLQTGKNGLPSGMWGKMPATMLAKCAEALSLRKAYPQDLSGIYTDDEMGQADNYQPQHVEQATHPTPVAPAEPEKPAEPIDVQQAYVEIANLQHVIGITNVQLNKTVEYVVKRAGATLGNITPAETVAVRNYIRGRATSEQLAEAEKLSTQATASGEEVIEVEVVSE